MAKNLLLVRHAKSSWKEKDCEDHERKLNPRGKRTAPLMAAWLKEKNLIPDAVLCSTAVRAQNTVAAFLKVWDIDIPILFLPNLYLADDKDHIDELVQITEPWPRVMLVGHNPGLEELLEKLTGDDSELPTCAVAHLRFPLKKWSELAIDTPTKLIGRWSPKELGIK